MSPVRSAALKNAISEAIWGMVIADAVAMPVHWFYQIDEIKKRYNGWITGYTAPCERHPTSILAISNAEGSGRAGGTGAKPIKPVIGSVILHDKLKFWTSGSRSTHYHQGMAPGDSTLTTLCCLEILQTLKEVDPDGSVEDQRHLRAEAFARMVSFLTTPGSHNDTYAESFIRAFFQDWAQLNSPPTSADDLIRFAEQRSQKKLSGPGDHQLTGISCLMMAVPWVLHNAHRDKESCVKSALDWCRLTHPLAANDLSVVTFCGVLYETLNGSPLRKQALDALAVLGRGPEGQETIAEMRALKVDSDQMLMLFQDGVSNLGLACYVPGSLTSLLLIAAGFADDFSRGVLMNANCGGENCHRGGSLGACLGAAAAQAQSNAIDQKWKLGVNSAKARLQSLGLSA